MRVIIKLVKFLKKTANFVEWLYLFILYADKRNHIAMEESVGLMTILANGPSLKTDIETIDFSNGDFLVVNDFYRTPFFLKIKPKYYVVTDPLFFVQFDGNVPFLKDVNWDMKLFVPCRIFKATQKLRNRYRFITIIPYNNIPYNGFERFRYRLYEKGYAMPKTQNVLAASIFVALNMGFKEIRLYGVDHSWTESIRVNEKNQVCVVDSHFYDEKEEKLIPWYKGIGEESGVNKMHEILRALALMFESYHYLERYAQYKGAHIVNYTSKSYIDAFERFSKK